MEENLRTLDDLVTDLFGERGTPRREKFERGSRKFKAEYLREMKTYKGKFVRLPGEVQRHAPLSVKLSRIRLSLLVRFARRKPCRVKSYSNREKPT